jgi:hypothetical protein
VRGQWQTSAMNFDRAADELHREEFSRLAYAVTPRPEALRAMTADALRDEIAAMWERLGHTVINSLAAPEIVTIKGERKFITMYANPSAPDATRAAQYGSCATGLLPPVPSADFMSPRAVSRPRRSNSRTPPLFN